MDERPNYYAIIPANVRYDKRLKPIEKLLYGEITTLTYKTGECWASNNYFSSLYDIYPTTISKYLNHLKELGYIKLNIKYFEDSKQIEKRIISIAQINNTYCQFEQEGIAQTSKDNNTSNNKKEIKKKSLNSELFNKFWNAYPKKKSKGDAEKWFIKNEPSEELVNTMVEKINEFKKSDQWKQNNGQYIPYPTSWLNAKGWEDELEVRLKPKTEKIFL